MHIRVTDKRTVQLITPGDSAYLTLCLPCIACFVQVLSLCYVQCGYHSALYGVAIILLCTVWLSFCFVLCGYHYQAWKWFSAYMAPHSFTQTQKSVKKCPPSKRERKEGPTGPEKLSTILSWKPSMKTLFETRTIANVNTGEAFGH